MNMCVQIVLCFLVYVPFYRIYSNSQVGTSSWCYSEDINDMNETIELEHDIEGLEEISNLLVEELREHSDEEFMGIVKESDVDEDEDTAGLR